MTETEQNLTSTEERKAHIRERYKGVDEDQLRVIPAKPKLDIFDQNRILNTAIYARVSTDDVNQTSSYELQKNHFTDLVNRNPNWKLVDIYADEGISGTSLKHRDSFLRMIKDCEDGKIDLIVTKSVSRFARNLLDCVGQIRKLSAMNPPVGVFFETENINTLNSQSELSIALISTMAQEESHTKSEIMNASIEMRFRKGIFLTPVLLGYDHDEDGNLIINEEEAKTVRLIFFMYLYGYSCQHIADTLNKLGRRTKKGNINWTSGSVMQQLQNERHCGQVRARKTFTYDYLEHKSKKNENERTQYIQDDHHEAIVSPADFIAVQHIIQNTMAGNKTILPVLRVIPDGLMAGYVLLNPYWRGFKPQDYHAASETIQSQAVNPPEPIEAQNGELDLRGFEIVRSQFLGIANSISVTFTDNSLKFSAAGIRKLCCEYVEILIHPEKKSLAVRPTKADNRLAFQWAKRTGVKFNIRQISALAFMPTLYELFGWKNGYRYRIHGTVIDVGSTRLLSFNTDEAEMLIPRKAFETEETPLSAIGEKVDPLGTKNETIAYPSSWAEAFGDEYYEWQNSLEATVRRTGMPIIIPTELTTYNPNPDIRIPDPENVAVKIQTVMEDIKGKEAINE